MERQLFNCILAIAAVSAESGLLVVNRFTLSSGTYKFPFPVTTTLIQNLISFIIIVLIERLANILFCCLTPREPTVSLDSDQEYLLRVEDEKPKPQQKPQPYRTEVLRRRSPLRRSAVHQHIHLYLRHVHVFWRLIPVAFLYLIKLVLGNLFLARLPLTTYTLLRITAIPLSFLLNSALGANSPSTLATCCLTVATLSVVLAMMPFSDLSIVNLLKGVLLSSADALFPVALLNTYDRHYDMAIEGDGPRSTPISLLHPMRQGCSNFWSVLRHLSFQSTALLVAHALISGELRSIRENCYVLDVGNLRWLLAAGGILNGMVLILTALLAMATFPMTVTFLAAPMNAFQLAIFMYAGFNQYRWVGLSVCWALSLAFIYFSVKESTTSSTAATPYSPSRNSQSFTRNIIIVAVLCGVLYFINGQGRGSEISVEFEGPNCPSNLIVETKFSGPTTLNHTRKTHDDYLGTRPHLDTIANLTFLVEQCKEIEGISGVNDVVNCLSILEHGEDNYFSIPSEGPGARGKKLDDLLRNSSDDVMDGEAVVTHDDILAGAQIQPESFFGKCAGPIIPFHVYWTGSASWRVELFIKAYLYTQNLACSRLWLWLDSDLDANAVGRMLCEDPIFRRFRPLVARGDIVLKSWNFPDRVPLAPASPATASTPDTGSNMIAEDDEIVLANGTVQGSDGLRWLQLKSAHASLAPVQVSDAVRFIVLHLHGGVYCDMDVLLLRDMRPLLLPNPASGPRAFAEQWVERCGPYDYNTAVISLPAHSPLSSYLLRGGARMGMNFHPRVIGRMLWKDGKGDELKMLHNAVFDPLVTNLRREGTDTCTVPCHKNFESAFMGEVEEKENEWSNYHGELEPQQGEGLEGNRSLANFFRGAWAYHIHNQWWKFPEPTSWMDVITRAQDGYFDGSRTNAYGEWWEGPMLEAYDREGW